MITHNPLIEPYCEICSNDFNLKLISMEPNRWLCVECSFPCSGSTVTLCRDCILELGVKEVKKMVDKPPVSPRGLIYGGDSPNLMFRKFMFGIKISKDKEK